MAARANPYSKATRGNIQVTLQANGKRVTNRVEEPGEDEDAAPQATTSIEAAGRAPPAARLRVH